MPKHNLSPLQSGAQQPAAQANQLENTPSVTCGANLIQVRECSLTIALGQLRLVLVLVVGVLIEECPPSSLNLPIGPGQLDVPYLRTLRCHLQAQQAA